MVAGRAFVLAKAEIIMRKKSERLMAMLLKVWSIP